MVDMLSCLRFNKRVDMRKIVLLKNNNLGLLCFGVANAFQGIFGENLCLDYIGKEDDYPHRIGTATDTCVKHIVDGGRVMEIDDYLEENQPIYLLNVSELDTSEVVERLSKYINKDDIVTFDNKDFSEFKKECKFLAEKMGSGKLETLDNYVDYLSDLDLDDCYAQKENGEDDYDTQLIYCLLEPFCNMLKEKGIDF